MTLETRKKIVPQMSDYDTLEEQWVPYLIRTTRASMCSVSVNTDAWGLRHTIGCRGEILTVDTLRKFEDNGSVGVVVGSSAVFGVGSTQDFFTIPSCLNRITNTAWLNLGGRAYNSTQELICLMLHLPKKLNKIILFSGVNNITLAFLSQITSSVYNSVYSQSAFERAMSDYSNKSLDTGRKWSRLLKQVYNCLLPKKDRAPRQSIEQSYQDILSCFERDLRVLKAIADGLGIPLYFALQPLATWINKILAPEETEIFKILDSQPNSWSVLSKSVIGVRDKYFSDVARICSDNGVKYYNLNLSIEFCAKEWLFVDRVHLTDRGCEIAANILKKEFAL